MTILQTLAPYHDKLYLALRRAKDEKGYSIQQLSELTGVPRYSLDRVFRGEYTHPDAFYLAALAAALELSMDDLLLGQHEPRKIDLQGCHLTVYIGGI